MSYKRQVFFEFLTFFISIKYSQSALLYPQFTVIQLVGSISVPITDLSLNRKVFFDWGLQMNYDMPYNVSSFYMVPIWPTKGSRSLFLSSRGAHKHDFTAKQLYNGIENTMERYGFDASCLKQSICELAHHPFDEDHTNLFTDVVNFFLKPSKHQGFSASETYEETLYRLAEVQGFFGKNCQELYPQCIDSLFNILTTTALTKT